MQRNGFEEFQKERISNAVFFDIDKFSLPNTNLPHMLPTKEQFEQ
jgi:3-mercaptopyruvate sulfurtransferase SseA